MWPQPPKYVTVLHCGSRWQIQSGSLVVYSGPSALDACTWLVFHGYVMVDTNTYERIGDHVA